jgi:DNA replication protein DnaC
VVSRIKSEPRRAIEGGKTLTAEQLEALQADQAADTPQAAREWVREQQALARRRLFEASVPVRFREASYDDLDPALQGQAAIRGWLASKSQTLLLSGPPGTGKTHAAYAVLRDAMEQGIRVYGCTVSTLLAALRPDAPSSPAPRLAEQVDVFLFDDLAAERNTEWVVEQIGEIVDARHREQRRQIITTNASRPALEEHLGQRTVSRLVDSATVVRFDGPDRRATW